MGLSSEQRQWIDAHLCGESTASENKNLVEALEDPSFLHHFLDECRMDEWLRQHLQSDRSAEAFRFRMGLQGEGQQQDFSGFMSGLEKKRESAMERPMDGSIEEPRADGEVARLLDFPTKSEARIKETVAKAPSAFQRRAMPTWVYLATAASLFLAMLISHWWLSPPRLAHLKSADGIVKVLRDDQWQVCELGRPLYAGDVLQSEARFRLVDLDGETIVELSPLDIPTAVMPQSTQTQESHPRGELVLKRQKSMRYTTLRGQLWSEIAPQAENSALGFASPHLRVKVLGTIIELKVNVQSSELSVLEGEVECMSLHTGERSVLSQGQRRLVRKSNAAQTQVQTPVRLVWRAPMANEIQLAAQSSTQPQRAQASFILHHDVFLGPSPIELGTENQLLFIDEEYAQILWDRSQPLPLSAGRWKVLWLSTEKKDLKELPSDLQAL